VVYHGGTLCAGRHPRCLGVFILTGLLLSGCATIQGGVDALGKGFADFRQGLADEQARRDQEAAQAEEQAALALKKSDPRLYDIREKWKDLRPRYQGPRAVTAPRTAPPYAAGQLSDGFLQDGLNMARFVRFLAGVPGTIELSPELNAQAQHGAVVLAALDLLTHEPTKPAGMDDGFYSLGRVSTGSSNLYESYGSSGTLADAVASFMEDSDLGNIDRVGHRRWVLSPRLRRLGFGSATSSTGTVYTAMQVFDEGNAASSAFDLILWPAAGSFPIEFFGTGEVWSVSFNPERYSSSNDVRVRVTRVSDGQHWDLSKKDADPAGAYLHVDTAGYGFQSAVIFRPGTAFSITAGDRFSVTVAGLRTKDGAPHDVDYQVAFGRLSDSLY
jgi:hypothetical protein